MIGDKELICRALLGDQEAQKECTEKGILIPCHGAKEKCKFATEILMGTIKQNVFVVVQKAQKSLTNGTRYHEITLVQHRLLESVVSVLSGKRKKSVQGHSAAQSQEWNEKAMIFAVKLNQRRNNYEN